MYPSSHAPNNLCGTLLVELSLVLATKSHPTCTVDRCTLILTLCNAKGSSHGDAVRGDTELVTLGVLGRGNEEHYAYQDDTCATTAILCIDTEPKYFK